MPGHQFPAILFLGSEPAGSLEQIIMTSVSVLDIFFAALKGAAEDAGLTLNAEWRYQGGSPLMFRQAVVQLGSETTAEAIGFSLAATLFGTSRAKSGAVSACQILTLHRRHQGRVAKCCGHLQEIAEQRDTSAVVVSQHVGHRMARNRADGQEPRREATYSVTFTATTQRSNSKSPRIQDSIST